MSLLPSPPGEGRPTRLGPYELIARFAIGGMAEVYLGRRAGDPRRLAIKRVHPHLRAEPAFVTMFLDEVRLATRIHHRNVVPTVDANEDGDLYMVMEYVEGIALSELFDAARALGEGVPLPVTLAVVRDVLAGVHAAHELRDDAGALLDVVHRDLSPHNVLVGTDGVCRILDFGVAKAEARLTRSMAGQIKGKIAYMSPEQIADRPITRQADLFAIGVTLWELVTGRRLFDADSKSESAGKVLYSTIIEPSRFRPDIPMPLEMVVLRCLEREPGMRFDSAEEVLAGLDACGLPRATAAEVGAFVERVAAARLEERRLVVGGAGAVEPAPLPDDAATITDL